MTNQLRIMISSTGTIFKEIQLTKCEELRKTITVATNFSLFNQTERQMNKHLREHSWNGLKIRFDFREARRDTRHLIVFFSGYRDRGTFDFAGSSSSNLKASILWIEDWFDDNHAYYIHTKKSGLDVSEAVQSLIEEIIREQYLTKDDCTLAGFSKGASGALYHALKYGYRNVIAAAPRMNMGTANRRRHPDVFENMSTSDQPQDINKLDRLIPDLLARPDSFKKNIYLFSSPADYQYHEEIEPFLSLYNKFENFNFIRTDSPLVTEHRHVTGYNVGLINAILTCCSEGMAPRFARLNAIGDNARIRSGGIVPPAIGPSDQSFGEPHAGLSSFRLTKKDLEARGWAFNSGKPADHAGAVTSEIVLRSKTKEYRIKTLSEKNPKLNTDYFNKAFVDYSFAGFKIDHENQTLLKELQPGTYEVAIQYSHGGKKNSVTTFDLEPSETPLLIVDKLYFLRKKDLKIKLYVLPILGNMNHNVQFKLHDYWAKDRLIHVEGTFATEGHNYERWDDVTNFLVLVELKNKKVAWAAQIAKDRVKGAYPDFGDPWNNYDKSYFATRGYQGIEVPQYLDQGYELYISQFDNQKVLSRSLGLSLVTGNSTTDSKSISITK